MDEELPVIKAPWWWCFTQPTRTEFVGLNEYGTPMLDVHLRRWHPVFWWRSLMALLGRGPAYIEMEAEDER